MFFIKIKIKIIIIILFNKFVGWVGWWSMEYKKSQTGIISPRVVLLSQGGTPRLIKY
jgi:hypothetical protein